MTIGVTVVRSQSRAVRHAGFAVNAGDIAGVGALERE